MKLSASPVKLAALARGVPVLQPASLKAADAQAELAALRPDLLIVAAYGLILPQAVLDIPRLDCLNIHASLLPRWRGAAPIQRALLAGDAETGVCIMQMEAGLDTGPVLLERRLTISHDETAGTLHDRLAALGAEAIVEVATRLRAGEAVPAQPQPGEGATYASKIGPEDAMIDWTQDARQIERAIRAFDPVPGAWTLWQSKKLKLWRASASMPQNLTVSAARALEDARPGQVLACDQRLWVACGQVGSAEKSVLAISEIQRPGGKRIPAVAWLGAAQAPKAGDCLG